MMYLRKRGWFVLFIWFAPTRECIGLVQANQAVERLSALAAIHPVKGKYQVIRGETNLLSCDGEQFYYESIKIVETI